MVTLVYKKLKKIIQTSSCETPAQTAAAAAAALMHKMRRQGGHYKA